MLQSPEAMMKWWGFTKKARIKNIAVYELNYLFRTLEITSGFPKSFWSDAYAVGFVWGCTNGSYQSICDFRDRTESYTHAAVAVITTLIPDRANELFKRTSLWMRNKDPQFDRGSKNGMILALYHLDTESALKDPIVLEAARRAKLKSEVYDSLPNPPEEYFRTGNELQKMLFLDPVSELDDDRAGYIILLKTLLGQLPWLEKNIITFLPQACMNELADLTKRIINFEIQVKCKADPVSSFLEYEARAQALWIAKILVGDRFMSAAEIAKGAAEGRPDPVWSILAKHDHERFSLEHLEQTQRANALLEKRYFERKNQPPDQPPVQKFSDR